MPSSKLVLPLAWPQIALIDKQEQIYCLSRAYNRLQVFDNKGNFLRGWFIDLPAGSFSITEIDESNIQLISRNQDIVYVFNTNGDLLKKVNKTNTGEKPFLEQSKHESKCTYIIKAPFFMPRIFKKDLSGKESLLTGQPFGLWWVTMPFPAFFFLLVLVTIESRLLKLLELREKYNMHGIK